MSRTLYVPHSSSFHEMTDEQLDRWELDLRERSSELNRRIELRRQTGEDDTGLKNVLFHCNRGLKAIAQVRAQRSGEPPPLVSAKPVHDFVSACQSVKATLRLLSFYHDLDEAVSALCAAIDAEDEDAEQVAWDSVDVAQRAIRAAYAANEPDDDEVAA